MKLAMISFTERGSRLCSQLLEQLGGSGYDCEGYAIAKYAAGYGLQALRTPLGDWAGEMFRSKDGMLFIGAAGIAVRAIAPWVRDKRQDPAVVVMDEKGMFAISLLSGHLGGANELAGKLSNLTGAIPVITTATDVNGRFAVDLFAKKNKLYIENMKYAKAVSADVLDEKEIGLYSEFPIMGRIPEELTITRLGEPFEGESGIVISLNGESNPFKKSLHLYPPIVTIGVGCRKGVEAKAVEDAILQALQTNHISIHSVEQVASILLKEKEGAILAFCKKYDLPFHTYTAEELKEVEGDFTPSPFVEHVTGIDNVCERSAAAASGGRIIQKKKAGNGVTVALAIKDWSVDFE